MVYPEARHGEPVEILSQELEFSFFPMRQNRRWARQPALYAADVWGVIDGSLPSQCTAQYLESARSFVRQAREYYRAADRADAQETRPLLYYYGLLNLAKAFAIARGRPSIVGRVQHGIAHSFVSGESVDTAVLTADRSGAGPRSVFDELHRSLVGRPLDTPLTYRVAELMPQSVVGHRLWLQSAGRTREYFVPVERIRLLHDPTNHLLWTTVELDSNRLRRDDRTVSSTLQLSGIGSSHRSVKDLEVDGIRYRRFEQEAPVSYHHRSADRIMDVVQIVKPRLWQVISSTPPYRRYYLYLKPPLDRDPLPQVLSSYALMFFLGSLTRYHPAYLFDLMNGAFGAFFREFLATQPQQLLFTFASEFQRQEVSRAAAV